MSNKTIKILLINFVLLSLIFPQIFFNQRNQILAEEIKEPPFEEPKLEIEPSIPGRIEGNGKYFEIKDSEYLNVSLKSSEEIKVILESIPRMISLHIESSSITHSTQLTLSGLKANKTYYKYQDSYKSEAVFVSDENGTFSWQQDLSQPHHIWIQEIRGTIFIPEDCSKLGIWDEINSTCTLTQEATSSVEITASNITLDCNGFEIKGPRADFFTGYGVYLNNKSGLTIKNCAVSQFTTGIYLFGGNNNKLLDNSFRSNSAFGILNYYSNNNNLIKNLISNNTYGLYFDHASNNILRENQILGNWINFTISGLIIGSYIQDIDTTNLINGKPIYYLVNQENREISGEAGFVGIINSTNITVRDLIITNNYDGILLVDSRDSKIENVNISNNNWGIHLIRSYNNLIKNSTSSNNLIGILISRSSYNIIENNNISNNSLAYSGIYLEGAGNKIIENTISNNGRGIYFFRAHSNEIYHNNFLKNYYHQVDFLKSWWAPLVNFFDNGYPSGGNYWSDYQGVDEKSGPNQDQPGSDGIGDTPYTFTGGQDRYPFIQENGWIINQPPIISNLGQFKSDGIISIPEGGFTTEDMVVFKATLSDPDNDQIKLQVELKEFNQPFNEQDLLESDFVNSGSEAVITRYGLIEGKYHWRARAVDSRGATSDWQEFGEIGNADFEVKLVPLYTQIRSPYPSDEETKRWFDKPYAYATQENPYPSCGWTIARCGCAITSMVMLGRYYNIETAIDNSDVNPGNINNWLTNNKGYTSDGSLWWGKAIEYLGYIDEVTGKKMVRFDFNPKTDYNVLFGRPKIDNFLDSAKPIVAHSKKFGHYFVVDGRLASTYTLKDPSWYNTKRLNQSQNLAEHIQGYNNYFDTANLFTYLEQPKPLVTSLHIYLASPAELLVTDPLGRKLGKDPIADITYNEIPDAIYTTENPIITSDVPLDFEQIKESKVIYIESPIDGHYDIQVIGTGSGSYALNTLLYDQNGGSKTVIQKGNTVPDNIQQFELDYSSETIEQSNVYRIVNIDIKPGSDPNSINLKSQGLTPVAVLTDQFFNAKDIVIDSIVFAETGSQKRKLEDVDNDGDLDLILHFKTQSLQLSPTSTEAILTAQLTDGTLIKGTDSVRIVQGIVQ